MYIQKEIVSAEKRLTAQQSKIIIICNHTTYMNIVGSVEKNVKD